MLSTQVLNRIVKKISHITGARCSVWDMASACLAFCAQESTLLQEKIKGFIDGGKEQDVWISEAYALFFAYYEEEPIYVLALEGMTGERPEQEVQGRLCASQIEGYLEAYEEKVSHNRFYQRLLLNNLLPMEVQGQAKKLRIERAKPRVVFVIEPKSDEDNIVLETVKGLYATGIGDFVTNLGDGQIVLIKQFKATEDSKKIKKIAEGLVDTIGAEAMVKVRVAYSERIEYLEEITKAFQHAQIALDVGRIFYMERSIFSYRELGIGRLLYQLPQSLCQMFLEEVFSGGAVDQFDEETMSIVNKFFENNLNISETARQLYLHRNTLMYRLEKIHKQTGLDIRIFEDAVIFKIAIMVSNHVKNSTVREGE